MSYNFYDFGTAIAPSLAFALVLALAPALSAGDAIAQGINMPGMGEKMDPAKGAATKTASGSGTVSALNASGRKVTLEHGPMPELNWPAMKMEFTVAPSVDLTKVKSGDQVRFTLTGSGSNYTVQSISPSP